MVKGKDAVLRGRKLSIDGKELVPHLETAWALTSSLSARADWDQPSSRRSRAMRLPAASLSIVIAIPRFSV